MRRGERHLRAMVDLAYASIFYNSEDLSEEVFRLEERLNDLVFDMRSLAISAARSTPHEQDAASCRSSRT